MRLMLGVDGCPSLLVSVDEFDDQNNFSFYVVNGCWEGKFHNGYITVLGPPTGDFSSLDQHTILTQNQDRLRGDYNDVFANFENESYVAPLPKVFRAPDYDDDIPF